VSADGRAILPASSGLRLDYVGKSVAKVLATFVVTRGAERTRKDMRVKRIGRLAANPHCHLENDLATEPPLPLTAAAPETGVGGDQG
jgi:hypothetical protein